MLSQSSADLLHLSTVIEYNAHEKSQSFGHFDGIESAQRRDRRQR